MSLRARCLLSVFLLVTACFAKKPDLVMLWPAQNPTLKLTFGTFRQLAEMNGKISLGSDVLVQNLTSKSIPRASLTVSLLDKSSVRLGSGLLEVEDLNPGQSAKIQFQCFAVGVPAMLNIAAYNGGGIPTSTKTIAVNVISVPPGAALKVDGQPAGLTPTAVRVIAGTHNLELHKDGFADAKTPLDVNPDDRPGGSITITLGGISNDTIELRDGSVLLGDVISMTLESVVVTIQGKEQSFDRNSIKKIYLVERTVTHVSVPEGATPTPAGTTSQVPKQ
jgi:PEGA domain